MAKNVRFSPNLDIFLTMEAPLLYPMCTSSSILSLTLAYTRGSVGYMWGNTVQVQPKESHFNNSPSYFSLSSCGL